MTPSYHSYSTTSKLDYTVVACDDGYIERVGAASRTLVACISWQGWNPGAPVRSVLARLRVDSAGATSIIAWLSSSIAAPQRPLLLLDSITIAGFDVVSPPAFKSLSGGDLIVVYTSKPRRDRLLRALEASNATLKHVKLNVILWMLNSLMEVETRRGKLYIATTINANDAIKVVEGLQAHARKPEPLRVAHLTASRVSLELWRRRCL